MKIRTRFAPSPTGYLHIGSLRTALFSYLLAKKNKGDFILRIEDTDQERYVVGAVEKLVETLNRVGLSPDEGVLGQDKEKGKYGPYTQSKKLPLYKKIAEELIASGYAYKCFCSSDRLKKLRTEQQSKKQVPRYDGHCRNLAPEEKVGDNYVIRFKIPDDKTIESLDLIHGSIKVQSTDLDDFVILKSDSYPTYHLANVVDDHTMKITHVIRGEEWIPSLPKHILLYQALGYELPKFIHMPLLLNPDRSKLSKRQGDVAVEDFLVKGYLPEALINYAVLLGWNPGDNREIFSLKELIKEFSLEKINKASGVFDVNKLNWFNAEYIRNIIKQGGEDYKKLIQLSKTFLPTHEDRVEDVLKLFGSRINYLSELTNLTSSLWELPEYPAKILIFKKSDQEKTNRGLQVALASLSQLKDKQWTEEELKTILQDLTKSNNLNPGDVFWPLRVALTGLEQSPSPTEILEFLGKEESIKRIEKALNKLK